MKNIPKVISFVKLKSPALTFCKFTTIGNEGGEVIYDRNYIKKEIIVEIDGEKYKGLEMMLLIKMED